MTQRNVCDFSVKCTYWIINAALRDIHTYMYICICNIFHVHTWPKFHPSRIFKGAKMGNIDSESRKDSVRRGCGFRHVSFKRFSWTYADSRQRNVVESQGVQLINPRNYYGAKQPLFRSPTGIRWRSYYTSCYMRRNFVRICGSHIAIEIQRVLIQPHNHCSLRLSRVYVKES